MKPDLNSWSRVWPGNDAWEGYQYTCHSEGTAGIWVSKKNHSIAQNNLGAWWIVNFIHTPPSPVVGPFESPHAAYATLRLME